MHAAFVLHGVLVMVVGASVVFIRAKQARREMDERMAQHLHSTRRVEAMPMYPLDTAYSGQSIRSIDKESGSIQDRDDFIPLPDKRVDVIETVVQPDS
jgi:FLVCR family MFS transporter 7